MELKDLTCDSWNAQRNLSADEVCDYRPRSPIGHGDDVGNCRARFEQLAGQMLDGTDTGVAIRQFARVDFRVINELLEVAHRHRGMHGDAENIGGPGRNRIEKLAR